MGAGHCGSRRSGILDVRARGGGVLSGGGLLRGRHPSAALLVRVGCELQRRRGLRRRHPGRPASLHRGLRVDPALSRVLVTAATLAIIAVGCARHHLRGDGPARPDSGRRDADAGDAGWLPPRPDVGPRPDAPLGPPPDAPCRPVGIILSFPGAECDARAEAICDEWAQAAAPAGTFAHAVCVNFGAGTLTCEVGDYCDAAGCRCTPSEVCARGLVCMSDTPDGPTRCGRGCGF